MRHCKTGSVMVLGWTLQDWECGGLGVDIARLGVWWSWSTDSNSECSESDPSVSIFFVFGN